MQFWPVRQRGLYRIDMNVARCGWTTDSSLDETSGAVLCAARLRNLNTVLLMRVTDFKPAALHVAQVEVP